MESTEPYGFEKPTDEDKPDGPTQIGGLVDALNEVEWDKGSLVEAIQNALIPVGTILATARAAAPTGFVLCEGQAVSRSSTTYKPLFEAIGTAFGSGNGSTTFNLPDFRGRTPVGKDEETLRLHLNSFRGQSGGEDTHKLTEAEMPSHVHSYYTLAVTGGSVKTEIAPSSQGNTTGNTGATGGGGTHNNMPPYQVVNYMIKL